MIEDDESSNQEEGGGKTKSSLANLELRQNHILINDDEDQDKEIIGDSATKFQGTPAAFHPFTRKNRPGNMTSNMSLMYNPNDYSHNGDHGLGYAVFGTVTNRGRFEKKIDEIKLLKKRTKAFEKAIILFNSGKFKETIDYLISIEAITALEGHCYSNGLNDY